MRGEVRDFWSGVPDFPLAPTGKSRQHNYFVAGDAYLCQLPSDMGKIKPLYQFLLEENYKLDGLVLSCVKQNIVLSCIMYDLDMTIQQLRSSAPGNEAVLKLVNLYHNLLRLWSET